MVERLVVVGASLAGLRAVESARAAGFAGEVTLVGAEPHEPYDRPPLTKALLAPGNEATSTTLRDLATLEFTALLGEAASALDLAGRAVVVGGREVPFDALILATGSAPRRLAGTEGLAGVHTVRTIEDSLAVRAALDSGARTVIVGAGFIGAEIASAARARDLPVTVVEALPSPLARAVGPRLGSAVASLHEAHGTRLLLGVGVEAIDGAGRVERVRLADGTVLDADLVVVGIGAAPRVEWLASSGLTLDNGVVCDEYLRAADGVFAAGDIARWPNALFGRAMRIEHWTNAVEQGTHAARNAVGDPTPFVSVPYFWSDWYGSRIQFVGVPNDGEVEVVAGELGPDGFVALYREGDRLCGALSLNGQRHIMRYRKLIADGASFADALDLAATMPPMRKD